MRTRLTILVPAVALAAVLTACGDSGPSKSEFTTRADASCAAGNTAISSVAKPSNAPQVAAAAGTATSTIDGQVVALRAMKMPGGDGKEQVDGIIAAIAEASAPTKALQDAAGKNDDAAMAKAASEMQAKVDAAAAQAQGYGMAQCGTGLKPAVANLFEGTKSVVKGSYLSKSEALCKEAIRRTNAVSPPGSTLASTSRYLDAVLVISNKLAGDLKAVPAPPGDEAAVGDLLGALEALNTKGKEVSVAAKANNAKLVIALADEVEVANTALNAKFDAYGLRTCGTVSS